MAIKNLIKECLDANSEALRLIREGRSKADNVIQHTTVVAEEVKQIALNIKLQNEITSRAIDKVLDANDKLLEALNKE